MTSQNKMLQSEEACKSTDDYVAARKEHQVGKHLQAAGTHDQKTQLNSFEKEGQGEARVSQ